MSNRIEICRRIVEKHQWEKIEGYDVDVMTANAMITIHDALKPENQAKFDDIALPILVDFCWRNVK